MKRFGYYTETDDVRGGMGLEGAAEFQKFVDEGGWLMTFGIASTFPAEFGLAKGVDAQTTQTGFYAPGPYVTADILLSYRLTDRLELSLVGQSLFSGQHPEQPVQLITTTSEVPRSVYSKVSWRPGW